MSQAPYVIFRTYFASPWPYRRGGGGGHLLLTARINIKSKVYARIFFIEKNYLLARKTSRNGSVRRFMGFPPTRRRKVGVHNVDSCDHQCAARTRPYRSIASVAQEESNRLPTKIPRPRTIGDERVRFGLWLHPSGNCNKRRQEDLQTSRCTNHNAPSNIRNI